MRDSVLVSDQKHCMVCGSNAVQRHHVFRGKNRQNADQDGFWVPLCMDHHLVLPNSVHNDIQFDYTLKCLAQRYYEQTHDREEFIERYGQSYL